jgi:carbon starvation protein CstA
MDWLTTRASSDDVLNPFAIISLTVFALVLVASGFYSARPWSPPLGETFSRHFVRRSATFLGWASSAGLFFLIIRLLQIDPATFGRPIWILLSWAALLAAIIVVSVAAPRDREAKRLRKAGHRPSQLARRPVRKRGMI